MWHRAASDSNPYVIFDLRRTCNLSVTRIWNLNQAGNTQNWPQPLAEALVKLPQGAVSSAPIQVGDAFWILRVDQKRPTQIPQYDQTKDVLRKQLEQAAIQKATAQVVVGLIRNAHIQQ